MALPKATPLPRAATIRNVSSTTDPAQGIEEVTYTGVSNGMMVAVPAHEIPDTACRILVDGFVHNPGLVIRRGPVTAAIAPNLTYPGQGMVTVVDPQGTVRVAAVHGDASHGYLGVYSTTFASRVDIALGCFLPVAPYQLVQTSPQLKGGVYISILPSTAQGSAQNLILWRGGGLGTTTTGTVSAALGSPTVNGAGTSWTMTAGPGMFVFAAGQYVGCIKAVVSDGVLTLESNALLTCSGASLSIQSLRGINPRVGKGYITTSSASPTVNGANTKFQADGLGTGTWDIFRSSDYTFIGTVSSITSDIQFTLTGNATLNLSQEPYTAVRRDGSYSLQPGGIGAIPTIWSGRQAYANNSANQANTSQVWFSSVDDAEAIDEAITDGDYITVPSVGPAGVSTPIVAMAPTPASLLILKEHEAYALFGQTTAQFQIAPVSSDGCLSPMSVQTWNGLVVYAGRQGIYMFDGQEAINITEDSLGWYYRSCVESFNTAQYRMWSLIDNDHYLLFIEAVNPPIPVMKGSTSITQTAFTIAIHLPSMAVSLLENVNIRGSVQLPSSLTKGTWYVVNNGSSQGVVCSADTLFDSDGTDDFACDGVGSPGPDFYLETKKYSLGDPLLKKLWKMLLLTYVVSGDVICMDTVPGLNEIGTTSPTTFPATGNTWASMASLGLTWAGSPVLFPTWASPVTSQFITKRIRFLKRAQMMSFRFWQNSNLIKSLALGPWGLIVKPQRVGRV